MQHRRQVGKRVSVQLQVQRKHKRQLVCGMPHPSSTARGACLEWLPARGILWGAIHVWASHLGAMFSC
jgi:hypothetical protein